MKKCDRCNKKILPEDRATMLRDFQGHRTIDSTYWHFQCFLDWKNEKIEEAAIKVYEKAIGNAIPQLKGMLSGLVNNAKIHAQNQVYR